MKGKFTRERKISDRTWLTAEREKDRSRLMASRNKSKGLRSSHWWISMLYSVVNAWWKTLGLGSMNSSIPMEASAWEPNILPAIIHWPKTKLTPHGRWNKHAWTPVKFSYRYSTKLKKIHQHQVILCMRSENGKMEKIFKCVIIPITKICTATKQ